MVPDRVAETGSQFCRRPSAPNSANQKLRNDEQSPRRGDAAAAANVKRSEVANRPTTYPALRTPVGLSEIHQLVDANWPTLVASTNPG